MVTSIPLPTLRKRLEALRSCHVVAVEFRKKRLVHSLTATSRPILENLLAADDLGIEWDPKITADTLRIEEMMREGVQFESSNLPLAERDGELQQECW